MYSKSTCSLTIQYLYFTMDTEIMSTDADFPRVTPYELQAAAI